MTGEKNNFGNALLMQLISSSLINLLDFYEYYLHALQNKRLQIILQMELISCLNSEINSELSGIPGE